MLALFAALAIGLATASARAEEATPKPISRPHPEYPRIALRNGVEGSVLLEFSVDPHGRVVAPRVIEAAPAGVFDAAALAAVSSWRYEALGTETANLRIRLTFRKGGRSPAERVAAAPAVPTPRDPTSALWLPPAAIAPVVPAAVMLPPRPALRAGDRLAPDPDSW